MAKAHITTKDGATINLEGTADEVAALVEKFGLLVAQSSKTEAAEQQRQPTANKKPMQKARQAKSGRSAKATPSSIVAELIEAGSFSKPKALAEIKAELEQGGHYFTNAAIATALLRKVQRRDLRRISKDGAWTYVA